MGIFALQSQSCSRLRVSNMSTNRPSGNLEISSCIWLLQSTSVCFQTKGLQGIGWGIMY